MKHLIKSQGKLSIVKSQERIDLLDNLLVKGINKFDSEIEAIKRIPENKRFIINNIANVKPIDDSELVQD